MTALATTLRSLGTSVLASSAFALMALGTPTAIAQDSPASSFRCEAKSFAGRLFTGRYITEAQACELVGMTDVVRNQLAKATEEVELLSQENLALRQEKDTLAERLAGESARADEAQNAMEASNVEFSACSAQRERLVQENAALMARNEALLGDGGSADERVESLLAQVSGHQADMDALATELSACQASQASLSAENADLQAQVDTLRGQLAELQGASDQETALSLTNAALRAEVDDLTAQVGTLETASAADAAELEALEASAANHASALSDMQANADAALAQAQSQSAERITELEAALASAQEAAARESALASQLVAKDVEIERLTQALANAGGGNSSATSEATGQAMRQIVIGLNDAGSTSGAFLRESRLVLPNTALFKSGSATLGADADSVIAPLAEALAQLTAEDDSRSFRFIVVGHADKNPISSERFPSNWELSAHRAAAVVRSLVDMGVDPSRLVAAGQAEFDPIDDGEEAESLAANRRVEVYSY